MNGREALVVDGALAGLAFLVLSFGYRLLGGTTPSVLALLSVAVLVALAAGVLTWFVTKRRV